MNGREEGGQYYISQTCDQERFEARKVVFSWKCLNIFASGCSLKWVNGWVFVVAKYTVGLFLETHLDQIIANERSKGDNVICTIPLCRLQMLLILFKMRNYNRRQN